MLFCNTHKKEGGGKTDTGNIGQVKKQKYKSQIYGHLEQL